MRRIMKETLIGIIISGLILTGFIGCVEEDVDKGDAPPLPPISSMSIDLSAFGGGRAAPSQLLPGRNYLRAVTTIVLLDTAVVAVLASPAAVFTAASSTVPVQQLDDSWRWSYAVRDRFGYQYQADLTGRVVGAKTLWSMKVSTDALSPAVRNFEWYTGESSFDGTTGRWRFFDIGTPYDRNEVGTVDWGTILRGVSGATKSELAFSSTDIRSPFFRDTLSYSIDRTTAQMSFYDASERAISAITWDTATTAGSIKVPGYKSGERACWDQFHQDIACPIE